MADYASLKVPELKKLLTQRGLPHAGNKADLIARLEENDKTSTGQEAPAENKEDEISYSDDEAPAAVPAPAPAAEPAAPAPAPVAEAPKANEAEAAPAATEEAAEKPTEEAKPAEEAPAAPAPSYALGLADTSVDEETKRRADRAKRFGIEEDDSAKKRAERAKRFGIEENNDIVSGLDSALPERPLKRGRGREGDSNRPDKRQTRDNRNGRRGGRNGRGGQGGQGGRGGPSGREGNAPSKRAVLDDPAEKAKAEKRAARFASS